MTEGFREMPATVELPAGFDPGASVRADMSQAAEWDSLLKRHGLPRAGQFHPDSPWDSLGNLRGTTAPASLSPGTGPANGGIAR